MPNQIPLFSIIVPIYNEERFIREALDSIAHQTDPDWEALLIDDGSTDLTPGILDEYAEKDGRFRVFHKSNGGQSSAINLGVREAKGSWLCWLSGDDYFHPQKLEMNRRGIQDYPEIQFFFTGFWLIEPDGTRIEYPLDWLKLENPAYHVIQLLRNNWVMGISICILREAWLKTGEFDSRFRYAHDLDMWVRLMLNTPNRYLPERTCTMRYHPGQETARFPLAPAFDASKILIRLVNTHSFQELFPDVDLNDRSIASDMLSRTIDIVAGEPQSNIYMLGLHPLVHLRMLEWIWDPAMDVTLREELRNVILNRAPDFISFYGKSPLGLVWQATYVALKVDQPHFAYFPCEPEKVGELNYYLQRAEHSEVTQPLRTYLEQNDGLSFAEAPLQVEKPGQLILLLPPEVSLDDPLEPEFQRLKEIWQNLTRVGFFVLLIGRSKYTLGLIDGLLYLGAEDREGQEQLLFALGDLDTVVALSHPERLKRVKAERRVALEISQEKGPVSELSVALIHDIQAATRKEIPLSFRVRLINFARLIYHKFVPESIRLKLELGWRLRSLVSFLNNKKLTKSLLEGQSATPPSTERTSGPPDAVPPNTLGITENPSEPTNNPKKQQVVFIAHALWGGGVEKVLYELTHGLDHERFSPVIVYLQEGDRPIAYDSKIETLHLKLSDDDFNRVRKFSALVDNGMTIEATRQLEHKYSVDDAIAEIGPFSLALRRMLGMFSQDAILVPMDERNTVILWLSQTPPYRKVLASQHYPYSQAQQIRFPDEPMRQAKEILYLNACRTVDVVTFDSEGSRWDFINKFGSSPKRTLFMPNPINCDSVIQRSRQSLPDNLQRLNRKTIFTQVARMTYEKNPLLLVEACDLLRKEYDDFVVFYVGNGPLFDDMREQINRRNLQDHILLLDEQANPYPYMANARALLLTSRAESSPLVLVESLVCGAVPIATDCVAGPRGLLGDGKYGLLVPPNDPQLFAEAMYQIATDDLLYNRLRENAMDWALRFDAPRVIKEWEELILAVAENRIDGWFTNKNKDGE